MSKGHKKPKDQNAPKKNQSSYFLFSNSRRSELQQQHSDKSITDISKIISAEWKAMDPETKKSFEIKAAEDKKRWQLEYSEYQKTDNYTKYQQKLNEWKENEKSHGRGKGGKKGKGPKKPKQPDSMPKRPQSSYFIFSNERRNELKNVYPDKKITELSKLIAEEWKIKNAEEKKVYEDRAAIKKEKYQTEIAQYKETDEYARYQQQIADWKQEKKRWESSMNEDSDGVEQPKVSLPRKPKDDKCPKRPLTSYFLYAKEVREATKSEFPNKAITEIAKEISKKWKVLSEDEKKPYNDEAARLKEQYKKDLAEYDGSDAQKAYQEKLNEWKDECHRRKESAKQKQQKKKQKMEEEKMKQKKKSPKRKYTKKVSKKHQRMDTDSSSESESDSDSDSSSSSGSGSSSSSSSGSGSSSGSESDSDSDSSSD